MIPNLYSFAKALHLIGMVSWMAGLFYLVRIMVYHAMAAEKPENEQAAFRAQYALMEGKAYKIILVPAVVITWSFGVMMLCIQPAWLSQGWIQLKLFFLLLLTGYTHFFKGHIKQLEKGQSTFTHLHYRALNEVPTILMVAIIFLAVFKQGINYWVLGLCLVLFTGLIALGIRKANK